MSKKMLKRSFALGALMAFVITGSAMAAEDVSYEGKDAYTLNNATGANNVVLNVTKTDYYGVYLNNGVIDLGSLDITSQCGGMVVEGQSVTINANNIKITTGAGCGAIYNGDVAGANLDIVVTNDLSIAAGQGIVTGDIPKSVDIKAKNININADYQGIAGLGDVKLDAENITIASKELAGYNAVETWATNAKVELIADQNINITGAVQGKARAEGQSDIKLTANNVSIIANRGVGEEASTDGVIRNVDIEAAGKVTIKATGNLSGVGAGSNTETMPHTENSIKAKEVEISSAGSFGVYANNHSYYATGAKNHCSIEAEIININSQKDGILVMNGAQAEVKGFNTLNIISQEQGIGSEYGDITISGGNLIVDSVEEGIRSKLGGDLSITTDLTKVTAGEGFESIKLTGDSKLEIDSETTQLDGDITTESYEGKNATLKVNFNGEESYLTGKVVTVDGANTELEFNGATWNVTGESNVSTLAGNDAKISVVDAEAAEGWVTVGENKTDTLTVVTASETTDTEGTLQALSKVVVDEDGEAAADEVQLTNAIYDNITAEVNGLGEVSVKDKVVAAANYSVSDMAAIGLMSWRAEMNDMNKRMGELRNANGEHGVWVRMVRGEDEYKSVKNQYNTYQLGYDEKLSVDKRWTVGAAVSYTDGETSFAKGSGENTNKAFSVYGSKLNADGTFIDLIAKYARLENEFKTASGMGDADYSTNGYSVSAEFGKRIQQGNGLWVEPQVELTYGKVSSVDYLSKAGVKVAQDGMESIVGRVGFSLGKDIKQGNVYARASYLYDFDGETSVSLGGQEKLEQDLGGGWWEVGVGANINLSKATYIYADVEKTFGGEVDTDWQWNLGVRYSF